MLKLSKKVQLNSDHFMVEHVNDIVKTNCLHEFCKKQLLSNVNNTFSNNQCIHTTTNMKTIKNSEISNLIEKHVSSNDAIASQNQEIKDGHKCESLETSKALRNKTQNNLSYKFNKGIKNKKSVPKMITYCSKKNCMEESVLEDASKSLHKLMHSANAQSNDLHECGMRKQSLDHCKNTSNNDCADEPFSLLVLASTHRDKQKPHSLLNDILSARDNRVPEIADNSDLFIASNRFYAQNEVKSLKDIHVTNTNESNSTTFSPCTDSDEEDHFSLAHLAAKHNKHNQQESTLDDLVSKHLNSNSDTFISDQKLITDLELSMEPQCFSEINSDDFNTISQLAKKQLISYESKINKEDLSKTLLNQNSKSSIYSDFTNTSPASTSNANDSSVRNTNSNFSNDLLFGSYVSNYNINTCEKTGLSECQGQGNINKDDDVDRSGLEINLSSALITTSFTEHIPSVLRNKDDVTHLKNITSLKTVSNPIERIDCLNDNNDWKLPSLTETASVKFVEVCCIDATHILKGKLDLRAKKCSSFGKTICKNIKKLQNTLSKEESVKNTIILPFSFECPSPDDNILKYTLRRNIL
uniref:Uncharacterized protein n=1 Tax=Clastoptera arizonana TaxID=38151 RepID=A0A1B6DVL8_9HEMI